MDQFLFDTWTINGNLRGDNEKRSKTTQKRKLKGRALIVDHSALEDEMGDKQWNTEAPEKTCEYKISVLITKD